MRFIKKRLGKNGGGEPPEVPSWARFMDQTTFAQFTDVAKVVRERHRAAVIDWDQGSWRQSKDSPDLRGFLNLAQICNGLEPNEWLAEIRHFVQLADSGLEGRKRLPFDQARNQLKVRLFPPDYAPPDFLVTAPYSDSFSSALVLDRPDLVQSVNKAEVEEWGVPVHELFKVGLANVFKQDRVQLSRYGGDDPETGLYLMEDTSFFTASYALMLDRLIKFDDQVGLFVIIPSRHFVSFQKVSKDVAPLLPTLGSMAAELFKDGPGSVTADVLWFRRGQFEKVTLADGLVTTPDELAALLQ
jgi:hypothetical protein